MLYLFFSIFKVYCNVTYKCRTAMFDTMYTYFDAKSKFTKNSIFQSEQILVLEKCITSVTCRKVYIIPNNPNANPWEEIGHQLQGHSDCHETSLLLVSTASTVIAIITDSDLHNQGVPIIIIARHISF